MKNLLRTPEPECGNCCGEGEKTAGSDPVVERICAVKTLRKSLDAILCTVLALEPSRETALARTHIEDAMMRLGMELKRIGEKNPTFVKNPYPDSKDPSNTNIAPAADGVFAGMPPHQVRVMQEKRELDEKIVKLRAFSDAIVYSTLTDEEKQRISDQLSFMTGYSETLGKRIRAF